MSISVVMTGKVKPSATLSHVENFNHNSKIIDEGIKRN